MAGKITDVEPMISLKILVYKPKNKLVYAEASHHFIDTLFSFMTLPMARLFGKLTDPVMASNGALANFKRLYESVENLPPEYLRLNESCKAALLNPRNPCEDHCMKLQVNVDAEPTKYFICEDWNCVRVRAPSFPPLNIYKDGTCYNCGKLMSREIRLKDSNLRTKDGVFVKETTFIITDDLRVVPNDPCASIQILNHLGIGNMDFLEERSINVGRKEMLDMLKWALVSDSPLTYAFLPNKLTISESLKFEPNFLFQRQQASTIRETKNASPPMMAVKAVVQKSNGKVLYTQTDELFTNFLFILVTLPVGSVLSIYNDDTNTVSMSLGCLGNLHKSISQMNVVKYLKLQDLKNMLLDPLSTNEYSSGREFADLEELATPILYNNIYSGQYSGYLRFRKHAYCGAALPPHNFVSSARDQMMRGVGFLKGPALFMVSDDFVVTPFTSVASLNLFHQLKVPLTDVEQHEVSISFGKAVCILKASLNSSLALTNGLLNLPLKKLKMEA